MRGAGAGRYPWIWALAVPAALWALVRVLGLDRGFPLVAMMAFTPYVALAAFLAAGLALALRNWPAACLAGLATLALALAVLPRAIGDGTVAAGERRTLRVLSANVLIGRADPDELVALVDRLRPDVLNVQELTPSFARGLRRSGIADRLPEILTQARKGGSGGGIYSRLPLRAVGSGARSFFRQPRAELRLPGGRRLRIADVHPMTPGRAGIEIWRANLAELPSAGAGVPWVLAGDFNATLDQSEFRDLIGRGYRDAGAVAGQGLVPTWPANRRFGPLITIDHVLADRRLDVVSYAVADLPGSDHRAVFAELAIG